MLVSRHGGAPAWSPDGKRLAIANLPPPDPTYNGNPERNTDEPPPLFAGRRCLSPVARRRSTARRLRRARDRDGGAQRQPACSSPSIASGKRCGASTIRPGRRRPGGRSSRPEYRPQAQARAGRSRARVHDRCDGRRAAAHQAARRLGSRRRRLRHIRSPRAPARSRSRKAATSSTPQSPCRSRSACVEPDASGIGGDGMALFYLKGMTEPVAIDYKDQVPIRATRDNPLLTVEHRRRRVRGEHPGRRRRPRPALSELREQADPVERSRRAGHRLRRERLRARRGAADHDRRGPQVLREVPLVRAHLPARRQGAEGRRSLRQQGLRRHAQDDCERRRRRLLSRIDRPAHRRRHGEERRPHHASTTSRSTARSSAVRSPAAIAITRSTRRRRRSRPAPRSSRRCRSSRTTSRGPARRTRRDADYLHYAIESWRVRDQGPRIADPALWDVSLGPHLDPAHAATLFKRIDPKKASRDRSAPASRRRRPNGSAAGRRRLPWWMRRAT